MESVHKGAYLAVAIGELTSKWRVSGLNNCTVKSNALLICSVALVEIMISNIEKYNGNLQNLRQ